jgi:D-amino-acid dehydrogenase
MHACVIGAGVVGLTTAYFLQAEGHRVTVVDHGPGPATGSQSRQRRPAVVFVCRPASDASVPSRLPSLLFGRNAPLKLHPQPTARSGRGRMGLPAGSQHHGRAATTTAMLRLAELSREFIEPLIKGEGIDCAFMRGGKLVIYPDSASLAAARAQSRTRPDTARCSRC